MIVSFVMVVTPVMTLIMPHPMTLTMTMALRMIVVAVLALVSRHVFVMVPVIAHEVDPPAAGVVLRTMHAPVPLVPRRHVKVNRRSGNEFRRLPDHHGLRINQLWLGSVADIDLTEESGLADMTDTPTSPANAGLAQIPNSAAARIFVIVIICSIIPCPRREQRPPSLWPYSCMH